VYATHIEYRLTADQTSIFGHFWTLLDKATCSASCQVRRFSPGVHVQDAIVPILYDLGCCSIVWLGTPCEDVIEVQQIYAYAVPYYNLEGGLPAPQFKYTNSMVSQNHKDGWHFVPNTQLYLTPSSACLRGSSPGLLQEAPALLQGATAQK
jgi:hypothetical protein